MTVPVVHRIVVGVDGSAESVAALRWACREAALRDAEVHAVLAWEAPCHSVASYAVASRGPSESEPGAADALQTLWRVVGMADAPGVRVRPEVAEGLAARVLLDRAEGADMLVLGTRAGSDSLRAAGPVLRACVRRAPCPVVVIGVEEPVPAGAPA
jgi:nucleotide-binding universal stress UspA family protein